MSSTLWAVTLTLALGQAPYGGCSTCNNGGGGYAGGGYAGGGYAGGFNGGYSGGGGAGPGGNVNITNGVGNQGFYTGSGGAYDPLYPYDYHDTWVHGHFQEIPAYGGYHFYRPYNYKHVLSQSQVAAGWGLSPTMPYSQEYFRRMQPQASSYDQKYSQYQQYAPSQQYQAMPTAAELARFRAQREIPASQASYPRSVPGNDGPHVYAELPSSAPVDPAVYVRQRNGQPEGSEAQFRQQQPQMDSIPANIPPEYRQAAQAALLKHQQQQAAAQAARNRR